MFSSNWRTSKYDQKGDLGEIVGVQASFGFEGTNIPRINLLEQGGGATLDIGIYPLALCSLILGPQKPKKIQAVGKLHPEHKTDQQVSISLEYDNGKLGSIFLSTLAQSPNRAFIIGTKGSVEIPSPFWCPSSLIVTHGKDAKPETQKFKLPTINKKKYSLNFTNSQGLLYEVQHVEKCLAEKKHVSDLMPLTESLVLAETMDEIRRQIGVVYPSERKRKADEMEEEVKFTV